MEAKRLPRPERECISDAMAELLRSKSPEERLAMLDGMWRSARCMIEHALRDQHPEWNDERILREIARRLSHGSV